MEKCTNYIKVHVICMYKQAKHLSECCQYKMPTNLPFIQPCEFHTLPEVLMFHLHHQGSFPHCSLCLSLHFPFVIFSFSFFSFSFWIFRLRYPRTKQLWMNCLKIKVLGMLTMMYTFLGRQACN